MAKNHLVEKIPLFARNEEEVVGKDESSGIIEQYKLLYQSIEHVNGKRVSQNKFYLTISGVILSGMFLMIKEGLFQNNIVGLLILAPAIAVNYIWYKAIRAGRFLAYTRWIVLREVEKKLPIRPFCKIWELMNKENGYNSLSNSLLIIPIILTIIYITIGVLWFVN